MCGVSGLVAVDLAGSDDADRGFVLFHDAGLGGKTGSFVATEWTEAEKQENPLRRGFLQATPNHHALQTADGTPFFVIGDTWYATGTNRFKWYDDDVERPLGPEAGFKDYVRYRQSQGYNWVNIIAAFPNWMTDGQPWHVVMNDADKTTVRSAWLEFGANSAKNMDNEGGRPFVFRSGTCGSTTIIGI